MGAPHIAAMAERRREASRSAGMGKRHREAPHSEGLAAQRREARSSAGLVARCRQARRVTALRATLDCWPVFGIPMQTGKGKNCAHKMDLISAAPIIKAFQVACCKAGRHSNWPHAQRRTLESTLCSLRGCKPNKFVSALACQKI